MNAALSVRVLGAHEAGDWAAYVARHGAATLFHDPRWSAAVSEAYRMRSFPLCAERDGRVCGILPLTLCDSPLLGRSLISAAFGVGGGVLADDREAVEALGREALSLGRRLGVAYVELRGGPSPGEGWLEKTGVYEAFEKRIPADPEEVLAALPRNRRAEVRKALKIDEMDGVAVRLGAGVDEFHRIYAAALRDLGTPVMPVRFLRLLKDGLGEGVEISLIEKDGAPVAGLLTFWRADRVMPYYVGCNDAGRAMRAHDYLYYALMRRAASRGVTLFDFGRSKTGSSHAATKRYWGFEGRPIIYHVALVAATKLPNVNPNNPKFSRFVTLWKKLPLPVANALGPIAARNFP